MARNKLYSMLLSLAVAFCLCAAGAALALDADRPGMTLYESAAGAAA